MGLAQYLFGKSSEAQACEFLRQQGCEIVEQNFHSKFGEIDIIARKGAVLHFVEVKATNSEYEAAYRVTPAKFDKILKAVDYYLLQNGLNLDFQIDLITIKKDKIEWIENISL